MNIKCILKYSTIKFRLWFTLTFFFPPIFLISKVTGHGSVATENLCKRDPHSLGEIAQASKQEMLVFLSKPCPLEWASLIAQLVP